MGIKYSQLFSGGLAMLFGKKANKAAAIFSAAALALSLTLTNTDSFSLVTTVEAADTKVTYDFRDGSIIPTDTNGKSDVTKGDLTVKVGTKNTYKYNGNQHGVEFKAGNSIEIKVDGPTKLTVGDCQYSSSTELTVKSADGSYSETKAVKAGCLHNDGSAAVFKYKGTKATTLILEFANKTYVPAITVEPLVPDVPDNNGAKKDSIMIYESNAVVTEEYGEANHLNGTLTSKDGMISITSKGGLYFHNQQHGLNLSNGDVIEVKVAGNATVKFNLCQYSADATATLNASSTKGEFVGETSQPLFKGSQLDGLDMISFRYEGVATTLKFTAKTANSGYVYLHSFEVANDPDPSAAVGNGKIDVWDFGAEQLDTATYNNMVTEDLLNSLKYYGTPNAEKKGVTLGTTMIGTEMFFNGGGKTNNRLRSTNKNIIRYDEKSLIMGDETFTGYLYSNTGTAAVYSGHKLYPGDILTVVTSSNGGDSTIYCESPSGKIQQGQSNVGGVKLTFYASEYGIYKIYSANGEKLTLFRAYREHTTPTKVSGTVDASAAAGIKDYKLRFTNKTTGDITDAAVEGGKYSVSLYDSYKYDVSLVNANGYVIKSKNVFDIAKGAGAVTENITLAKVDLVTVTGKITGLSADALKKLKLAFVNKSAIYVPEFTISGDSITLKLEKGVTYDITADGVNDYNLTAKTISKSADSTQDIAFAAKPTYAVNLKLAGLPDSAKANAVVTFTNINEKGYVYTFKASDKMALRDGTYTVKVTGTGTAPYAQKLTSNAVISGKAIDKTVNFEALEVWDFSKYNAGKPGLETIGDKKYYLGLGLEGSVAENKTYLLLNKDGKINIPVKKGQVVTLEYCYQAAFDAAGEKVFSASGSTSKYETAQITATKDGVLTITGIEGTADNGKTAKQTYFTKISVTSPTAYRARIAVGANKEFKTINAALDAVAKMDRGADNKRVTIVIDPGNYEEMLVINQPNVSLVNAAGKNSSLELTNKGVDITKNVVRITSYYGHGYDYYSMGSDCKYDEELLAVNKANGSLSNKNPGSGTTNGSYWNATVVVMGSGFEASGIVFENSFNQYISKKEASDKVVMWDSGSKGQRPTTYGDTSVQNRSFVERAAAMAIVGDKAVFNNCKFIGRQDTLYGAQNIKVAFNKCDVLGAVDFIFGGMTAVFYQSKLRMNTDSKTDSDQAYLTAAQQTSGRGYLMYECTITSTTPGVDTASEYISKPGYLGRPWSPNTAEVVFYNTTVETTNHPGSEGKSLIVPQGWNNTLSGESKLVCEFGTTEKSGEDNSKNRVKWSNVLDKPYIDDGKTEITIAAFLGDWEKTLSARGFFSEDGNVDLDENPATGIPGANVGFAAAALAGAAIAISKKKRK